MSDFSTVEVTVRAVSYAQVFIRTTSVLVVVNLFVVDDDQIMISRWEIADLKIGLEPARGRLIVDLVVEDFPPIFVWSM